MAKWVMMIFAVALGAGCAYPTSTTTQGGVDSAVFFTGAPESARVLIDGVDVGTAAYFDGRRQVLAVEPGTHSVRVIDGGQVLLERDVYVGRSSRVELNVD